MKKDSLKTVTIFRDIITEQYDTDKHYFEEMTMDKRAFGYAEEGMSPVNERYEVQQYPVETFCWQEVNPKAYHKDWKGNDYIRHEFHYVATKQFKEKFKIFFDAHNALKDEIATKEYLLKMEKRYHSDCLQELLETSYKLREFESMSFWERLKFLFRRKV